MRNDLDTARGIFWWAVVPLVLLVVSVSAFALPVYSCPSGMEGANCDGGYTVQDHASVEGTVYACIGGSAGLEGFSGSHCDGTTVWVLPANLQAGDYVQLGWDTSPWLLWESFSGFGGGPGDPAPGGEWTLEDLDLSKAAGAFSAAFMFVAAFWALGKGAGVIVNFVRRM